MFVLLETLISKNQNFLKSSYNIDPDQNPTKIFIIFYEIEDSVGVATPWPKETMPIYNLKKKHFFALFGVFYV